MVPAEVRLFLALFFGLFGMIGVLWLLLEVTDLRRTAKRAQERADQMLKILSHVVQHEVLADPDGDKK